MGNKKSKTSESSTDVSSLQRIDIQNDLLVWLDKNVNENDKDCQKTILQLREIVTNVKTFIDSDQCIQFINNITDSRVCMIISGSLGQNIMPRVHTMSQVNAIFIFCSNRKLHEQWAKEWSKIKGVFTDISLVCQALRRATKDSELNAMSMSFVPTTDDISKKKLDQLEPSFMYTQILKEILLTIEFEEKHFKQFIDYCRDIYSKNHDQTQLENIKKLERNHRKHSPVWWYTCNMFLYGMVNRALRTMDADIIIRLGFFIRDLHRHIEQLHSEQFPKHSSNKSFTVYRGQGLTKEDFEKMKGTKGGLISFNCFLSTSKNLEKALYFADEAKGHSDYIAILFNMAIDPSQSTTPFASITNDSYFREEDEVLFSMHTVFRIGNIKSMDKNNYSYEVNLTLTSDNDKDLRTLADRIRQETFLEEKGWFRMGSVLLKMGEFDQAKQMYGIALGQVTNKREKASIYHELGRVEFNKGQYQEAIRLYDKTLEKYRKTLNSMDISFANCYNDMGLAYYRLYDYSKALSYYDKALEIQQQILSPNHPNLAASYTNKGVVYYDMRDYSNALSSHDKSLKIRQQSLPSNHPDLADSNNNMGNVYYNKRDYSKALLFYEKALQIRQQSLPSNHPDLAASYNNLGLVHCMMHNYTKALSSHEEALGIRQKSLASNHADVAASYNNIGFVHYCSHDYSKACSYYERAVKIAECSLSANHPDLLQWRKNLEDVKKKL